MSGKFSPFPVPGTSSDRADGVSISDSLRDVVSVFYGSLCQLVLGGVIEKDTSPSILERRASLPAKI